MYNAYSIFFRIEIFAYEMAIVNWLLEPKLLRFRRILLLLSLRVPLVERSQARACHHVWSAWNFKRLWDLLCTGVAGPGEAVAETGERVEDFGAEVAAPGFKMAALVLVGAGVVPAVGLRWRRVVQRFFLFLWLPAAYEVEESFSWDYYSSSLCFRRHFFDRGSALKISYKVVSPGIRRVPRCNRVSHKSKSSRYKLYSFSKVWVERVSYVLCACNLASSVVL